MPGPFQRCHGKAQECKMKWIPAQLQNGMDNDFVQNLTRIFHRKSAGKNIIELQSNENENTILRYIGGLHQCI